MAAEPRIARDALDRIETHALVATGALQHLDVLMSEEIADVLQKSVSNELEKQIIRLNRVLGEAHRGRFSYLQDDDWVVLDDTPGAS